MEENKISLDTPLGKLCAGTTGSEEYPGIYIYMARPDGVEIDLVIAEVDAEQKEAAAYVNVDTSDENWIKKHIWTEEDIDIDMEDNLTMSDEMMYTLEVGFNQGDVVKVPGLFRSAEKAREVYEKCYAATFPFYVIGGEPVYQ